MFNDSQDVDSVFLWTLLPQSSYPIDNEGFWLAHLGGEVYGYVPLGSGGKLRYDGYAGQSYLPLIGGYIKQIEDSGLPFTTSPGGKTYGGDVRWKTPWKGFLLGFSPMALGVNGEGEGGEPARAFLHHDRTVRAIHKGQILLCGRDDRAPFHEVLTLGRQTIPIPSDMRSWYAMGSYRLTRKINVGSHYSHYVNKALDTSVPANYSKDWVVSGRYDFSAYFSARSKAISCMELDLVTMPTPTQMA